MHDVATYPLAGGRHKGLWVRLPREENMWSRHHKGVVYELLSVKGSGVVFTHGEGISTPRVRHKGRQPLIKCANMTSICFIFLFTFLFLFMPFVFFFIFLW